MEFLHRQVNAAITHYYQMPRVDHPRLQTLIEPHKAFMLALSIFILRTLHICWNSLPSATCPVNIIMPRTKSSSMKKSNAKPTPVAESPSAKKSKATAVPLSEEEINVLRSHLDEWNRNKGKMRRRIKEAAIAEARFIAPKMDKKLLKLRTKVSVSSADASALQG
jgi:hypothetical protein